MHDRFARPVPALHGEALEGLATSLREPSILVVDDDQDAAELLVAMLRRRQFAADYVNSGRACLDRVLETHVDAVVTDIGMPGMTGLELCAGLRARSVTIAIVILTGFATIEAGRSARLAGASEFLVKPVRIDALAQAVRRALELAPCRG